MTWLNLPADIRAKVDAIQNRPGRHRPRRRTLTRTAVQDTPTTWVTPREAEVLALLVDGLTNLEIAQQLAISDETVKSHLAHLLLRTLSRNRVHLAIRWERGELTIRKRG